MHAYQLSTCVPRVRKHSRTASSSAETGTAGIRRGSAGGAGQRICHRGIQENCGTAMRGSGRTMAQATRKSCPTRSTQACMTRLTAPAAQVTWRLESRRLCDLSCHARTAAVNAQRAGGGKQCHAMFARASDAEAMRGAAAMAEQGWAIPARLCGPWSKWQTWMHQHSQALRGTVYPVLFPTARTSWSSTTLELRGSSTVVQKPIACSSALRSPIYEFASPAASSWSSGLRELTDHTP